MNFRLLVTLFLLFVISLAIEVEKPLRVIGTRYHRNATELKAYHQEQRAKAAKLGRFYDPTYPDTPVHSYLYVGKSEKMFPVSFETTSDTLWVLDKSYPDVGSLATTFDPNDPNFGAVKSGSYNIQTEDWEYQGNAYTAHANFLVPMNLTFGSVTNIIGRRVDNPTFDTKISGALGLMWNPELKDEPVTSTSAPILLLFAYAANSYRTISQATGFNKTDGRLSWCTTTFAGNLDYYCERDPVVIAPLSFSQKTNSLTFQIASFTLGYQKADGGLAKVDTGSSLIYVPYEAFMIMNNVIRPDFDYDIGAFTTSCANRGLFDKFIFTVDKVDLFVPSTSYIVDLGLDDGQCVVPIQYTSDDMTPYALGTPFLFNYGVVWSIDDTTIAFKNYLPNMPCSDDC